MNNKWFTICLVSAFAAGIILTVLSFMIFSKPMIEENVVYTNSVTTVDVNESIAIKNMMQLFDSLPDNKWMNFSIRYHVGSKTWYLNLDYDEKEYSQEFKSYDELILFISDDKIYYDGVMSLGK